jgi:hypothetical protein
MWMKVQTKSDPEFAAVVRDAPLIIDSITQQIFTFLNIFDQYRNALEQTLVIGASGEPPVGDNGNVQDAPTQTSDLADTRVDTEDTRDDHTREPELVDEPLPV